MLIMVNYCCHPENKNKLKSLKSLYNIEIFNIAIKKSNYEQLSLSRKVSLFCLKHKLIYLCLAIGNIRQHQFGRS